MRPRASRSKGAIASLSGLRLQTPPVFSAKRVGGQRAYDLAPPGATGGRGPRARHAASRGDLAATVDDATVRLVCSAGFYVRTFAHDLGLLVGSCACLAALRRTRAGRFTLEGAVDAAALARAGRRRAPSTSPDVGHVCLLPDLAAVQVDDIGLARVRRGQELGRQHVRPGAGGASPRTPTLDARPRAERRPGGHGDARYGAGRFASGRGPDLRLSVTKSLSESNLAETTRQHDGGLVRGSRVLGRSWR